MSREDSTVGSSAEMMEMETEEEDRHYMPLIHSQKEGGAGGTTTSSANLPQAAIRRMCALTRGQQETEGIPQNNSTGGRRGRYP